MKLDEAAKDANAKDAKPGDKDKDKPATKALQDGTPMERSGSGNSGASGVNSVDVTKEKEGLKEKERDKEKSEASGMISPESLEAT